VLLAVPSPAGPQAPVGLLYEDSDCGSLALAIAARHARRDRRPLAVYVMAPDAPTYERKRQNAEVRLGGAAASVLWKRVEGYGATALEHALSHDRLHLLVIGCDVAGGMRPESWMEIAERADCPVLLTKLPIL
jgi:hypothetical protein